jgi:hypothetical protein
MVCVYTGGTRSFSRADQKCRRKKITGGGYTKQAAVYRARDRLVRSKQRARGGETTSTSEEHIESARMMGRSTKHVRALLYERECLHSKSLTEESEGYG